MVDDRRTNGWPADVRRSKVALLTVAFAVAVVVVAWFAQRGPRDSVPGAPSSPRSTGDDIGGVITGPIGPMPPPPPYLPAFELTVQKAGATLEVLYPLGLTQLSRGRYLGAMSYLQPALELADGTTADEIRWYLGIAHHRTVARVEAYRLWDIVCEGDSRFSATACETLQALRSHDAEVTAWRQRQPGNGRP